MIKKNKVLFFGPYPTPFTGQSISFRQVYKNFKGNKILFDTTIFKNNKFLNSFYCVLFLPLVFIFKRFDKVYFTCSRSKLGFLKDFQLIILSKIFNKKIVNHLHGADFKDFYKNSGCLRKIISWSYNQININIVLLPAMKSQFSEFKSTKIQVVENCYTSDFENVKIDYSNKKKQILYLSNLIYSKGILIFMDFAEELLKLEEDVIVKVAGAPMADSHMTTEEIFLEFKLKSDNLKKLYPNRFFYMGVVKGKQKEELLKESSIFILPTFYKTEAFPLTIVEAMYFGNLIITTKHNYLGDVINQTNGSLVTTKSVNELIDATLFYLDNHEELKKIMISNHFEAKEKYNPKKFNDSINKIIQEA